MIKERRTTWNTRVPTWPHDTEAMVGIALGLKQGVEQEGDNTQAVKSYKRKRKGGRRKSVDVSGYTRRKPR